MSKIEMTKDELDNLLAKTKDEAVKSHIKNNAQIEAKTEYKGKFPFASYVQAVKEGRGDVEKSLELTKQRLDKTKNGKYEVIEKALMASDVTAGGVTVPLEVSMELIAYMNNASPLLSNIQTIDIPSGALRIPKETAAATIYDNGEASNITETTVTYTDVNLNAKETSALVGISNKLLQRSALNFEEAITNRILNDMRSAIEYRLLKGSGSSNQIKGLYYQAASGNKFNSAGTTLDNITTDAISAMNKIMDANNNLVNGMWLMPSKSYNKIKWIKNSLGISEWNGEVSGGTWFGFNAAYTNAVPSGEVYLMDMDALILGIAKEMEILITPYGSYTDASGNQVNGLQKDLTVLTARMEYDVATKYDTAISVIESVGW